MSLSLKTGWISVMLFAGGAVFAQYEPTPATLDEFDVATIRPTSPDWRGGAYFTMQGGHRFMVQNYSLKALIGAAWYLMPGLISGGPAWTAAEHYDIVASTPGKLPPDPDAQMSMLRSLASERFQLTFHREEKELSIYTLTAANGGPRIKRSEGPPPDGRPALVPSLS